MSKKVFKCAEDPDHVNDKDVAKLDDVLAALEFFTYFEVPCSYTAESFTKAYNECATKAERHDLTHMLLDDLIKAADAGHEAFADPLFTNIIIELREVQSKCRADETHEK